MSNYFDYTFGNFVRTPQGTSVTGPLAPITGGQSIQGATLSSGPQGNVIAFPGAASAPNTAKANPTAQAPINAAAQDAKAPAMTAGSLGDYFARAIIIVLGFIFVAVGLNMLRPGTLPVPKLIKP